MEQPRKGGQAYVSAHDSHHFYFEVIMENKIIGCKFKITTIESKIFVYKCKITGRHCFFCKPECENREKVEKKDD